jgi:hypothetical protein
MNKQKSKIEYTNPERRALSWILETLTPDEVWRNLIHAGCPWDEAKRYTAALPHLVKLSKEEA